MTASFLKKQDRNTLKDKQNDYGKTQLAIFGVSPLFQATKQHLNNNWT